MYESKIRSVVKGVTWRIIASGTTMLIVYIATGNLALVAGVGLIDVSLKFLFYYLHERTWGKVRWGFMGVEPQKCPPTTLG